MRQLPRNYSPEVETIEKNEVPTTQKLLDALLSISEVTYKDTPPALRNLHAKSHDLLRAGLQSVCVRKPATSPLVFWASAMALPREPVAAGGTMT